MTDLFDLPFEDEPDDEAARAAGGDASPELPPRHVYTISELAHEIEVVLADRFFDIWLEGEVSNCRRAQSGHCYFTLKDDGASLRGVMFASAVRRLRFRIEDGLRVLVRGRLTFYGARGDCQVVCDHMEPQGAGALQLAFEQLKRRLDGEGLFALARKRRLPLLPRRVGVVTSIDGAALRDIVKVLRLRHAPVHLVVAATRVQGEGAAADIARRLAQVGRVTGVDVIIVARGGGSIEDLWAFNEEVVARAMAAAPVPVVAGIGHETDVTIADFVADLRAATPSNAAELVVAGHRELAERIERLDRRAQHVVATALARRRVALLRLEQRPGLAGLAGRLASRRATVGALGRRLTEAVRLNVAAARRRSAEWDRRLAACDQRRRLRRAHERLVACDRRTLAAVRGGLAARRAALAGRAGQLGALSPLAVLGRGYALCWDAPHERLLREATPDLVGTRVHVTLERGGLECDVRAVEVARRRGDE
ncbi:MAG: exodeoxyribonuclease VII large subunit [Vicinamibacteraceae bacterium]|nr:exodeoxyribonuclease VII large subunit [Vicinamibacteraceae bacterium]